LHSYRKATEAGDFHGVGDLETFFRVTWMHLQKLNDEMSEVV
jgi:hypothetical protein